ncbi:hypothetical protein ARALYDRAFT_905889 [Arabidopsis lyrata subsp. lyrata]|uniref:TF-B3 domain-containing protein n=1 Tax=Arabidopsis lyrata subsp. lyrata TaxID=81972 RepID=D7LN55_ARALL|nr:hypothetical protein ARALYDRAFT_905889 [Arabidopsis lyrata subsp. lyrata]
MDPNKMLEKVLTDSDLCHGAKLYLPKKQIEKILSTIENFAMPPSGFQVELLDNNKSYSVTIKKDSRRYYMCSGWTEIREARNLKTGDKIRLYLQDTKFIFTFNYALSL